MNQPVGTLSDIMNGIVVRKIGDDSISFPVSPAGLVDAPAYFYHKGSTCDGDRYAYNFNGVGFVFLAQISGKTAFYTRLVDPNYAVMETVGSVETVAAGHDPAQKGDCSPSSMAGSFGIVVSTDLSSLVAPFKIQ